MANQTDETTAKIKALAVHSRKHKAGVRELVADGLDPDDLDDRLDEAEDALDEEERALKKRRATRARLDKF